jgi:hypothetical protein
MDQKVVRLLDESHAIVENEWKAVVGNAVQRKGFGRQDQSHGVHVVKSNALPLIWQQPLCRLSLTIDDKYDACSLLPHCFRHILRCSELTCQQHLIEHVIAITSRVKNGYEVFRSR